MATHAEPQPQTDGGATQREAPSPAVESAGPAVEGSLGRAPPLLPPGRVGTPRETPPAPSARANVQSRAAAMLIVDDDAPDVTRQQMRKTQFLDRVEEEVRARADRTLAARGLSTEGCPYFERWFSYYRDQSAAHVERALLRYAPEAQGARAAEDYVAMAVARVHAGVVRWAETGEISGAPEELALTAWGGDFGALFGATFPPPANDPRSMLARLGEGTPLESGLRSRMEGAFEHSFAGVRVHSGSAASGLASSLGAQAFTIGENIGFASGRYQPGTPLGEAMLAHELAHVVQQSGGSSSWRGGAESSSLEQDANLAALGALASSYRAQGKTLQEVTGRKQIGRARTLEELAKPPRPQRGIGLTLQRCGGTQLFQGPIRSGGQLETRVGDSWVPPGTIGFEVTGANAAQRRIMQFVWVELLVERPSGVLPATGPLQMHRGPLVELSDDPNHPHWSVDQDPTGGTPYYPQQPPSGAAGTAGQQILIYDHPASRDQEWIFRAVPSGTRATYIDHFETYVILLDNASDEHRGHATFVYEWRARIVCTPTGGGRVRVSDTEYSPGTGRDVTSMRPEQHQALQSTFSPYGTIT